MKFATRLSFYVQFVALVTILLVSSCDKSENLPQPDLGLNYFPLKLSSTTIYNVDSLVYSDFTNTITTFQFLIKDSTAKKIIDAQGDEAYILERYKKIAGKDWVFQKIIAKKIAHNRAEEFVDNHRYVRLVFPVTLKANWNGNLYNSAVAWPHTITTIDEPLTFGALKLDSTVTVKQYDEVNLIRQDIYSETYAKNVGLVRKEVKAVDKDISTQKIKRGYHYTMQLNSYK